jgi:uncharacterized protein (DUF433 family)
MVQSRDDLRFAVSLYTQAEAARYLGMPASTFRTWTHSDGGLSGRRSANVRVPLVSFVPPRERSAASVPFVGLAEGLFLSALRRAGVPLQRIRPALEIVRDRLGVEHALASRRLYHDGAELLWEVSEDSGVDADARHDARSLIVLRNGQYVFRQLVEQYLTLVTYDEEDGFADLVRLPDYEVADVSAAPTVNFGRPVFTMNGSPVAAVLSRLRAGETVGDVASDFDLPGDQVTEVAFRAGLHSVA